MKLEEQLLPKMKADPVKYSDGIIKPDGDYILLEQGHLHTLMNLLPGPEGEIWDQIPQNDSPLFWMIEQTGCVITDYNSSVGMTMTPEQEKSFRFLVQNGIITDKYFDITSERQRRRRAGG